MLPIPLTCIVAVVDLLVDLEVAVIPIVKMIANNHNLSRIIQPSNSSISFNFNASTGSIGLSGYDLLKIDLSKNPE
jgi:hypothetical protein